MGFEQNQKLHIQHLEYCMQKRIKVFFYGKSEANVMLNAVPNKVADKYGTQQLNI